MKRPSASNRLDRGKITHILRSVAAVTQAKTLVIIGTGAVIAGLRHVPLEMMLTRELDIYAEGPESEQLSDLIDGTLGEGSQFDVAYGYYAHGVGERTACMPSDWRTRAKAISILHDPEVICLCPDPNDIAVAKACAWRDKDREWIMAGARSGVLRPDVMLSRIGDVDNSNAPDAAVLESRILTVRNAVSGPNEARQVASVPDASGTVAGDDRSLGDPETEAPLADVPPVDRGSATDRSGTADVASPRSVSDEPAPPSRPTSKRRGTGIDA